MELLGILAFAVALLLSVMVHELGHYLTAKRFGMKVSEFFLGFGKRIWSFTKGETEFGIKAIPAGGYCRIEGMSLRDEMPAGEEGRAFFTATSGKKLIVLGAGSFAHLLIGFILIFAIFFGVGVNTLLSDITKVSPNTAAAAAGFLPGDKIREVELEAIAVAENPDPNPAKIVGPFNPTNYQLPGENVPKAPPEDSGDDFFNKLDNYTQLADFSERETPTFSLPGVNGTSPPIQATPFINRAAKNRERRVGAGGRANLANPDFGAMFGKDNRSLNDIYGQKTSRESLTENSLEMLVYPPDKTPISLEIKRTLTKLNSFLEEHRAKNKIILEDNEQQFEIEMKNDELLIESVSSSEEETENNVDISDVDLSNLD